MKKILILGGTQFIGRNLIEILIQEKKYDITLFNRGISNPDLFPTIKKIKGDRKIKKDLLKICSKDWDCIIDISGYWPIALEEQFSLQKGNIGRYIYISTFTHYQFDLKNPHLISENEPIVSCSSQQKMGEGNDSYNQRKAECERVIENQENLDYIILRPGLIIGKYDYTDRIYYWLHKVKTQKEILIPNEGKGIISFTNVIDLCHVILQSIEFKNNFKVYNVPSFNASILDFITSTKTQLAKDIKLISASTTFLEKNEIRKWFGLPFWVEGDFLIIDNTRIMEDYHFKFLKIDETVSQMINYFSTIKKWQAPSEIPDSLSSSKEKELIQELKLK